MALASSNKSSLVVLLFPLALLVLGFLIVTQGIEQSSYIIIGIVGIIVLLLNYNLLVAFFFFINFINFFKFNLFGIFALNQHNVTIILMMIHFLIIKKTFLKKSLFERKFINLLLICFSINLVVSLKWIFSTDDSFLSGSNATIGRLSNYFVFPGIIIFSLSQIFKILRKKEDLKYLLNIIVFSVIIAGLYLAYLYISQGFGMHLWSNKTLGHKNTYGPFYVLLFFVSLTLYRFEKKYKTFYLLSVYAILFVITISLSRNAYFSLLMTSIFLTIKGVLQNKNLIIGFVIALSVVFLLHEDFTLKSRVQKTINPLIQGDIETLRNEGSSGHFSEIAFEEIGYWLSNNALFGGFFESKNHLESGWTELLKNQGLLGLYFYIALLVYFGKFFSRRLNSINIEVRKYSIIGYSILIGSLVVNTTSHIIYTYSNSPFVFLMTFVYLAVRWSEEQEKKEQKEKLIST